MSSPNYARPLFLSAVGFALLLGGLVVTFARDAAPRGEVRVVDERTIEIPAIVNVAGFESEEPMAGYHAVVFRDGSSNGTALFRAAVTDRQVLDGLLALGAEPGDALGNDTWSERRDPGSAAPDKVIAGPPIELSVILPGNSAPMALADLLEDPGGRGLELRFGGHEALIDVWRSGCIVCLYSCPGSKVGNARYTVRDFVSGATRFRVRSDVLPPDGTSVTLRLALDAAPQDAST